MKNVYQAAMQFEKAQQAASEAARSQRMYRTEWLAQQIGLKLSTLRDRIKKPELWAPAELVKLCTLLGEMTIGGTEVQ